MALIIRMIVSAFFVSCDNGKYERKGAGNVDRLGYRQTKGGNEDMEDGVFGRGHDSMELMAKLGSTGYMQRFYEFLQGKFHPENITAEDAPILSGDQAWHVIY